MTTTQTQRIPQSLIEANHKATAGLRRATMKVDADMKAGLIPSPNFAEYEAAAVLTQTAFNRVGSAVALVVAELGHVPEVGIEVEDADGMLRLVGSTVTDAGGLREIRIEFTEDGKPIDASWHSGPEEDAVRYVALVFTETGRIMGNRHGFIDSHSRKITQVG